MTQSEMDFSPNTKPTQCGRIIQYMEDFGSITPLQAMKDLGVMRLAARICELKKYGVWIDSDRVEDTNRYGETVHFSKYTLR